MLVGSGELGQPANGARVVLGVAAVTLTCPVRGGAVILEELLNQPRCHSQLLCAQRVGIVRHVASSVRFCVVPNQPLPGYNAK